MGTPETSREPCPDRILDDAGGGFSLGAIGGSIYHFIRGSLNSPRGERFSGGIQTMRMNAPRTAGGFAVWGSLFSASDCAMVYVREKEDPWNSVVAGAFTCGLLSVRSGLWRASKSAAFGAVFLALIEGAQIMMTRLVIYEPPLENAGAQSMNGMPILMPHQQSGGGKGGDGEAKEDGSGGSETKVLESYDSPTPMPNFEYK